MGFVVPDKLAVLVLPTDPRVNEIVLGLKKAHLFGGGKWNGLGGKVELGEDPANAAFRELEEESGLIPEKIIRVAYLSFYFPKNPEDNQLVEVFVALGCDHDVAAEFVPDADSEMEALEIFDYEEIPYTQMCQIWDDDSFWLPIVLRGNYEVVGQFIIVDDVVTELSLVAKMIPSWSNYVPRRDR